MPLRPPSLRLKDGGIYRPAEHHYPELTETMAATGNALPAYVDRKFDEYLRYGRLDTLARVPLPGSLEVFTFRVNTR